MPISIIENYNVDNEGLWSLTNYNIAITLCRRLMELEGITKESVITDAMAGVGGNTIPFAQTFKHVNSVEICENRKKMLDRNISLYKLSNVTTSRKSYSANDFEQDIVYFDPPWGENYKDFDCLTISIRVNGRDCKLHDLVAQLHNKCKYVVLKLPINYNMQELTESLVNMRLIDIKKYNKPNSQLIAIFKNYTD
jgi:predicted RNA methylase